jgi:hypothetical protein
VHIPTLGGNGRSPEFISLDPARVVGFAADVGGSKVVVFSLSLLRTSLNWPRLIKTSLDWFRLRLSLPD